MANFVCAASVEDFLCRKEANFGKKEGDLKKGSDLQKFAI